MPAASPVPLHLLVWGQAGLDETGHPGCPGRGESRRLVQAEREEDPLFPRYGDAETLTSAAWEGEKGRVCRLWEQVGAHPC